MRSKIVSCVYHVNHTLLSLLVKKRNLQQNCYKYYGVMPRSSTHVLNMQLTREKLKKKSVKYLGNVNVSLQVSITLTNDIIKNIPKISWTLLNKSIFFLKL